MKLRYLLFAEQVILERDNLAASAINVTDEITTFAEDESGAPLVNPDSLPFSFMLLMAWRRDGDSPGQYPTRIAFFGPDQTEIASHDGPVVEWQDRDTHTRFLGRVRLQGIPFRGSGDYGIAVFGPDSKEPDGTWKLRIQLLDKKPEP